MSQRASTVAELVSHAAQARPDHPAVISGNRTETWASLDALVSAAAHSLNALGLTSGGAKEHGDRVALVMGSSVEFVALYAAIARAGLVAVPLNPTLTSHELAAVLADAGVRLVVRGEAQAGLVNQAVSDLSRIRVMSFDALVAGGRGDSDQFPEVDPESLALLLYTSGTSGLPKGAMLTHRALMANVEQVASLPDLPITPDDVVLLVLPLFHVYGLNGSVAQVARQAATVVLVDRFDPAAILQTIQQRSVTHIPVVPSMLQAFLQVPADSLRAGFSGVRHVLSGAAPLSAELATAFSEAAAVPVFEGYGLTEAAPGVTLTFVGGAPKPGSIGRPLPGVEVRLVDVGGFEFEPNGDGDPEEGPGELSIRGDNLFSGYWPDGSGGPDDDGWLATGDVGYRDVDGDFVLVDRTRELIIVNGFNVYPREIESVLAAHPQVAEAAALGIPDEETGEAVKAFVVAMPGTAVVGGVRASALRGVAGPLQAAEGDRGRRAAAALTDGQGLQAGAAGAGVAVTQPRIQLLTKPGCHLCEDARNVVAAVAAETGEQWVEVDVTEDPKLFIRWGDELPVVLVDGEQRGYWRIEADRLRAALNG